MHGETMKIVQQFYLLFESPLQLIYWLHYVCHCTRIRATAAREFPWNFGFCDFR